MGPMPCFRAVSKVTVELAEVMRCQNHLILKIILTPNCLNYGSYRLHVKTGGKLL